MAILGLSEGLAKKPLANLMILGGNVIWPISFQKYTIAREKYRFQIFCMNMMD